MLLPIEDLMNHLYFSLTVDGEPREPVFTENFFTAAISDPEVPGQLLVAMKSCGKGLEMTDDLMEVLKFIHDEQIKCRSFSLWMKRRKGADIGVSFRRFIDELSSKLRSNLLSGENPRLELQYLLSLEPTDIRLMDLRIITDKAREWLNQGIKKYHEGSLDQARALLEMSNSTIPSNPFGTWNLARISYVQGNKQDALKMMDQTMKFLGSRELIKEAKREQELMRRGTLDKTALGPRAEDHV
jgi:hypothetical protein